MKKLFSLLLALAMCASLAACGGGDNSKPSASGGGGADSKPAASGGAGGSAAPADVSEPAGTDGDSYENYTILAEGVELYEAPAADSFPGTTWSFAGGFTSGKELTPEEANSVLEMYGGTLQIEFVDAGTANMVQGGGTMPGTYRILDDKVTMNCSFELQGTNYDYVIVFTNVGDQVVMVLVSSADPSTALYMTQDL